MEHSNRIKSLLLGALLTCAALGSARADDTEIFFTTTNINVPANIMLVLDTSGSMTIEVEDSTSGYDPAHDYGGGCCASSTSTSTTGSDPPDCGSSSTRMAASQFKCQAADGLGSTALRDTWTT